MTDRAEARRDKGAMDCIACARSFVNAEAAAQHVRDAHGGDTSAMMPYLTRGEMLARLQALHGYGDAPVVQVPRSRDHAKAMAGIALFHLRELDAGDAP